MGCIIQVSKIAGRFGRSLEFLRNRFQLEIDVPQPPVSMPPSLGAFRQFGKKIEAPEIEADLAQTLNDAQQPARIPDDLDLNEGWTKPRFLPKVTCHNAIHSRLGSPSIGPINIRVNLTFNTPPSWTPSIRRRSAAELRTRASAVSPYEPM